MIDKQVHVWAGAWLRDRTRKALTPRPHGERHLLLAVCDHFEPLHGGATREMALARVRDWRERLPRLASRFRDSDGRLPRHTFFFPGEDYDPRFVEPLAEMVEMGLGEVEVHLHHDGDTRESLATKIRATVDVLSVHGVVPRRVGLPAWSFIHGNWSLANGRPDGRWCGVDDELRVLHDLGCYADFTFPSAPDPCQPPVVNMIYYARDDSRRRGYDEPEPVAVGSPRRNRVLLVQGPLAVARRPGSALLRIESSALSASDPPTAARLTTWVDQWVHVAGRPEWTFVKLHAHGAPEANARIMLGEPMGTLHDALRELARRTGAAWRVHYVTAREMYNVARAAMDGRDGSPVAWLDYEVPPPERAARRTS